MTLLCLECGADMVEVEDGKFHCPLCGWGAEQIKLNMKSTEMICGRTVVEL